MKEIKILEEENSILVDDKYDVSDIEFFPEAKKFKVDSSLKDDVFYNYSTYEYKIYPDPIEVSVRLLEKSSEPPKELSVKDGVVLESEMKKDNSFLFKDHLESLSKQVKWNKLELSRAYEVVLFILSKHPEIISPEEYRRYLRHTEQRIKAGLDKVDEKLKKEKDSGLHINNNECKSIWYSEEIPEKEYKEKTEYVEKNFYTPLFDEKSSEYSRISREEFYSSFEIIKHIDYLLNKKEIPQVRESNEKISKTKGIIISLLLTLFISWVVSWFVDINPFLIFVL